MLRCHNTLWSSAATHQARGVCRRRRQTRNLKRMDEALAALNEARERHFLADARVALAGGADMNDDYDLLE